MNISTIRKSILAAAAAILLPAALQAQINVSPAPGEVAQISKFTLTFDAEEWGLENRSAKFSLTGPEGVEIPRLMSYSNGSSYIVYLEDPDDDEAEGILKVPGEYVFTVPAGKFNIGGTVNEEMQFRYTIAAGQENPFPEYSVTPEPGDYEELSVFSLTFANTANVTANNSKIAIVGPTDNYGVNTAVIQPDNGENISILQIWAVDSYGSELSFSNPGSYKLIIGAGAISVGSAQNPDRVVLEYTIGGSLPAWEGQYTADPASGSELEELSEVFVTLEGVTKVTVVDNAGPADFPKVYDVATDRAVATCMAFASENILDLSIPGSITTPGDYRLVVPSGFYLADGRKTGVDISLEYTIKGEVETFDYTYETYPGVGEVIDANDNMMISFEAEGLDHVDADQFAWGNNAPHITSDDDYYTPNLQVMQESKTSFMFSHEWPFEDYGFFTLVIPAGYFTLYKENGESTPNKLIEIVFKVDNSIGVETLTEEEGRFTIYSIDGKVILRDAEPGQASSLPAGVYVVGNRKIFTGK